MKLLKEAKANLTDELIDVVLKSENNEEYDVGYYFGVKSVIQDEELRKAVGSLSYLIGEQEEKHYSEWYDCDKPDDIPTDELEEHALSLIHI